MKKKMVFVIAILSIGFSRLSLGKELITESKLNENFFKLKSKSRNIKINIKVVPYLNVIVKKEKNKKVEVKGSAAKDTSIEMKEEVKIIAVCDNSKW
ncbi:MAG: hypothetical protein ACRC2Q_09845 [Cetobacterium sp.]